MKPERDYQKDALIASLIAELSTKPTYFVRAFTNMVQAMIDMRNGVPDVDPIALKMKRAHHMRELLRIGFPGEREY